MKALNVYLFFSGNCEEAVNFYKHCLDGEITLLKHFKDGGDEMKVPDEYADKVMHAELKAGDIVLVASDGMPNHTPTTGDNIHLSIHCDNAGEQDQLFQRLSEGGKIIMPLNETFWGSRFGMLTDRYGIHWMLSCELAKN